MSSRGLTYAFTAVLVSRAAGHVFSPVLLVHAPLTLLAASPFLAHLVVTAPLVSALPFAVVALPVSILHVSIGFQFGRANGPAAVRWLEVALPHAGPGIARLRGWVERAAPVVLLVVPGPLTATLAGASGVSPARFYAPMLVAQVVWTWAAFVMGSVLESWVLRVRDAVASQVVPLTVLLVLVALLRRLRAAKSGSREG